MAISITIVSLYWGIQQSAMTEIFAEYVQGDISAYIVRFTASCVLLGIMPLVTILLLGYSMRDIGLRRSVDRAFTMRVLLVGVAVCIFFGISGSRNADMAAFYPYSKTIALYAARRPVWLALHVVSYVIFYYMPWEICFRGMLLLPFVNYEDAAEVPGGDGSTRAVRAVRATLPYEDGGQVRGGDGSTRAARAVRATLPHEDGGQVLGGDGSTRAVRATLPYEGAAEMPGGDGVRTARKTRTVRAVRATLPHEDAAEVSGGDRVRTARNRWAFPSRVGPRSQSSQRKTARNRWKFPPAVVFMQVIPSTMLHFGHPPIELFASILFGFFAGYLVWRTRSIFTLWILHSVAGVAQDIAIIMQ